VSTLNLCRVRTARGITARADQLTETESVREVRWAEAELGFVAERSQQFRKK
jgi:hypothetical protein